MTENTLLDPVCGSRIESEKANYISDYEGMRYYFCSDACKHRFDRDPEAYLESELTATEASD